MSVVVNPATLRNIIFDLGDVIIPIDLRAPIRNFATMANMTEADVEALWKEHDLTMKFETGLIDDVVFREHVRQLLKGHSEDANAWADEVIDTAWNTVLLDLPVERIERIKELRTKYRLFLLSNTSPIHIQKVNQILQELGQSTLEQLFERVFYSYEVKLVKPSHDIYHYVLDQAGLVAKETAFLDDNAANIQGAKEVGIQAVLVQKPLTILDYLQDV